MRNSRTIGSQIFKCTGVLICLLLLMLWLFFYAAGSKIDMISDSIKLVSASVEDVPRCCCFWSVYALQQLQPTASDLQHVVVQADHVFAAEEQVEIF
jgi:hypothetical protein